jgi:hypothetical protein
LRARVVTDEIEVPDAIGAETNAFYAHSTRDSPRLEEPASALDQLREDVDRDPKPNREGWFGAEKQKRRERPLPARILRLG